MQKLDQSISRTYQPLVIWPDQLTEVFEIIASCTDVSLVADNIKYDSVDELVTVSKGRSPKMLEIRARNPHLSIDLDPMSARLYVSSSELIATGLFAKLDMLLRSSERRPKFLYRFVWAWLASLTLPNLFYLPVLKPYAWLSLPFSVAVLAWMLAIAYVHLRKHSSIQTGLRENQRSFVKRNIDAIVVAVVSALLGAVGGAVATKLADRYWPSTSATSPPPTLPSSPAPAASK